MKSKVIHLGADFNTAYEVPFYVEFQLFVAHVKFNPKHLVKSDWQMLVNAACEAANISKRDVHCVDRDYPYLLGDIVTMPLNFEEKFGRMYAVESSIYNVSKYYEILEVMEGEEISSSMLRLKFETSYFLKKIKLFKSKDFYRPSNELIDVFCKKINQL